MSSCCCFLLRQLFLVQKTAHARGAVREPRAMVIGSCLRKGGHPFFDPSFGALFSLIILIFDENCLQNEPTMRSVGSHFLEKVWKWKSVFGLLRRVRIAYETIPWSAQSDQKVEEKKQPISEPLFLAKNENIQKKSSKRSPKGWVYFRGGASWGTFGAPSWFLIQKVSPQRPQSVPSDPNMLQKWSQKGQKWS